MVRRPRVESNTAVAQSFLRAHRRASALKECFTGCGQPGKRLTMMRKHPEPTLTGMRNVSNLTERSLTRRDWLTAATVPALTAMLPGCAARGATPTPPRDAHSRRENTNSPPNEPAAVQVHA